MAQIDYSIHSSSGSDTNRHLNHNLELDTTTQFAQTPISTFGQKYTRSKNKNKTRDMVTDLNSRMITGGLINKSNLIDSGTQCEISRVEEKQIFLEKKGCCKATCLLITVYIYIYIYIN